MLHTKIKRVKIANTKSVTRTINIEHHFPKCAMLVGVIENKHFYNGMNQDNNLFNSVQTSIILVPGYLRMFSIFICIFVFQKRTIMYV